MIDGENILELPHVSERHCIHDDDARVMAVTRHDHLRMQTGRVGGGGEGRAELQAVYGPGPLVLSPQARLHADQVMARLPDLV